LEDSEVKSVIIIEDSSSSRSLAKCQSSPRISAQSSLLELSCESPSKLLPEESDERLSVAAWHE
jgi:hypothetical protein